MTGAKPAGFRLAAVPARIKRFGSVINQTAIGVIETGLARFVLFEQWVVVVLSTGANSRPGVFGALDSTGFEESGGMFGDIAATGADIPGRRVAGLNAHGAAAGHIPRCLSVLGRQQVERL